jgi:hypothetical protein
MAKAVDIIQASKTWQVMDSTKLQSFMECPRKYFYEYVLGWRNENPSIHLEFGSAWHLAMEHMIRERPERGYSGEVIREAWQLLNDYYRQFFPPEFDQSNAPKEPGNALYALVGYAKWWEEEDREDKPLYTEIAGVVSLSANRVLHFKMDSILELQKGITSREHKTGSQLSRQWRDQWSLSIQTGTYNHVLYCLFPEDQVWGVEINGSIFNKTKTQYERVPSRRTKAMLNAWLMTANYWYDNADREMDFLFNECAEEDDVLRAYPCNPTNCNKYFGCQFMDFCMAWPNPLRSCAQPPMGYKIEHWNPAEESHKHYFTV